MPTYSLVDDFNVQKSVYNKLSADGMIFANPATRKAVVAFHVPPITWHEEAVRLNPNEQTVIYVIEPRNPSSWDDLESLEFWTIIQENGANKTLYDGNYLAAKQALHLIDDLIGTQGSHSILISVWAY